MLFSWDIYEGMGDVFIYPVLRTPYSDHSLFKFTHWIMQKLHYWLIAFAYIGCLSAWLPKVYEALPLENKFFLRCVSLLSIYFLLIHCIGAPFARYSIPMQPIIYALAMFGVSYVLSVSKYLYAIAESRLTR